MRKILLFTILLAQMILCADIAKPANGADDSVIDKYRSILKKGLASGELFYNLGNTYLKKGEIGRAILNYERAGRFIPRDSDLISNRALARSKMKQSDMREERAEWLRRIDRLTARLTLKETLILGGVAYYLFTFLLILAVLFRKFRLGSALGAMFFCLIFVTTALSLPLRMREYKSAAIVVDKITDARFEPIEGAEIHFPVYEGMKVYLLKESGVWCKIKRPDGKIGWVPETAVKSVIGTLPDGV